MIRERTVTWWKSGAPWIWLNAGAVSISLIMVLGLLLLILIRGMGYFWPADVMQAEYRESSGETVQIIGEIVSHEIVPAENIRDNGYDIKSDEDLTRYLVKIGNRDLNGKDFSLILKVFLSKVRYPGELLAIERREWGNAYGYLQSIKQQGQVVAEGEAAHQALDGRLQRALALFSEIRDIQKHEIGAINYQIERLRLKKRRLELDGITEGASVDELQKQKGVLQQEYEVLRLQIGKLFEKIRRDSLVLKTMDGREMDIPLAKVVRAYMPNAMGVGSKLIFYVEKIWEFVSDDPREANTEGGIFPAIFGTVLMVILMSIIVTPFGVVAAVYLREYAKQGIVIRIIRIAVNNLAGVPSIVYGVFGLGFFVYFLGGNIDALFFPESAPAPTFGTPGILWSSLTLALLTLPVVIVATEEGLSRIPRSIREGSLALGATKAETLWRIILPMSSPAMMTGLILAVARAAGEVAPLMLVGVVKLAPSLPLDGNAPFLHVDRKFMHLGFHIYDVGFQSPNVEAARPLVYATSLVLILVIVLLNLAAIKIRNRLRERYRSLEH